MSSKATTRRSRLALRSACGPSSSSSRSRRRRASASGLRSPRCATSSKRLAPRPKNACRRRRRLPFFGFSRVVVEAGRPSGSVGRRGERIGAGEQRVPAARPRPPTSWLVALPLSAGRASMTQAHDGVALRLPQRARASCAGGPTAPPCRWRPAGRRSLRARARATAAWRDGAPAAWRSVSGESCCVEQVAGERGRQRAPATWRRQKSCAASATQLGIVLHQLQRERHAGGERRVGQRALAEAVDREDRRLVEGLQREVEAQRHRVVGQPVPRAQRRDEAVDERVVAAARPLPRRQASVSTMRLRMRSRSSAVAALVKVTTRMLLHLEPALEQQPQVQAAEVPGLAGAGRGLDQARAVQRAGEDVELGGVFMRLRPSHRARRAAGRTRLCAQARKSPSLRPAGRAGRAARGGRPGRRLRRTGGSCVERQAGGRRGRLRSPVAYVHADLRKEVQRLAQAALGRGRAGRAASPAGASRRRRLKRSSQACQLVCSAHRRRAGRRTAAGGAARLPAQSRGARLVVARAHQPARPQVGEAGVHAPGLAARSRVRSTPRAAPAAARAVGARSWAANACSDASSRSSTRCARRRRRAARCRRAARVAHARDVGTGAAARQQPCGQCAAARPRRAGRARRPAVPRRRAASSMPSRLAQQEAAGVAEELRPGAAATPRATRRRAARAARERRAAAGSTATIVVVVVAGSSSIVRRRLLRPRVSADRAAAAAPQRIGVARDGSCAGAGRLRRLERRLRERLQRMLDHEPSRARAGPLTRHRRDRRRSPAQVLEQFGHQHRRRQRGVVAHAAADVAEVELRARREQQVEEQVALVDRAAGGRRAAAAAPSGRTRPAASRWGRRRRSGRSRRSPCTAGCAGCSWPRT